MQQMPLSARTSAPPSVPVCFVSSAQRRDSLPRKRLTEYKLVRDRIAQHSGRQTDTGRSATGCVDSSGRDLGDVLEQLRLGHTGVAHEADVQVATNLHTVADRLGDTADEEQQQRALDVLVTEDFRSDAGRQPSKQTGNRLDLLDLASDLGCQLHRLVLLLELLDVVRFEVRVGEETHPERFQALVRDRQEDSARVDDVSWRDGSGLVTVEVNDHCPRNVANGHLVRL